MHIKKFYLYEQAYGKDPNAAIQSVEAHQKNSGVPGYSDGYADDGTRWTASAIVPSD
jgi:hypothetical protein